MSQPVSRSGSSISRRRRSRSLAILASLAIVVTVGLPCASALAGPGPGVTLVGPIGSVPAGPGLVGDWSVSGVVVHVAATATIDQGTAAAAVGALAQVKGKPRPDGSIDAAEIKVLAPAQRPKPVEVTGIVASLPPPPGLAGDWEVGPIVVHVGAAVPIDQHVGPVGIGAVVRVKGTLRTDHSVDAVAIAVKRPAATTQECELAILGLAPTATAPPGAGGTAITRHIVFGDASEREDLKVTVEKLLPQVPYDVLVDGINAGLILSDERGAGHLFLSSADVPGAEPLPAELRPLSDRRHVEIDAVAGAVLVGDLADAERQGCGHPITDYLAIALLLGEDGSPRGVVVASTKGDLQLLRLTAWSLTPGAAITLVADGSPIGNLTARDDGTLSAAFSTSPVGGQRPLPPAALPVSDLLHAELLAAGGATVASGDFALPPGE
jgi:hypothetical protein